MSVLQGTGRVYGKGRAASTAVLPLECRPQPNPGRTGVSSAVIYEFKERRHVACTEQASAPLDLVGLPAECLDSTGAGGVGADRRLSVHQPVDSLGPARLPAEQCAAGPGQCGAAGR